ncbi:MAG: alpha/beta fold hydrolase [Polyangiaceae bacterium]|nr:alpha/beta fold hydrolase [Polyangiaceae bacterium]
MRKLIQTPSVYFILATFFTLAVAGAAACSSSSDDSGNGNTPDSGTPDGNINNTDASKDSSTVDSGSDPFANDPNLIRADLGTCQLEGGGVIQDCHLGYRMFGTPAPDGSNIVLWPTYFTGNTAGLVPLVPFDSSGKTADLTGYYVDISQYCLVLVDSLGDGVSSGPSTGAPGQQGPNFPMFTIRDMVNTQYHLVKDILKVDHIHAVAGISMGGMQAIQWSVSYPDFMDKIVAIVGDPQLTSQDKLLWTSDLRALENDPLFNDGNYTGKPVFKAAIDILNLVLTTPQNQVNTVKTEDFDTWLANTEVAFSGFDGNDWRGQLKAMLAHDVSATPTLNVKSLDAAAAAVQAKSKYFVSTQDHVVNPIPTRNFAASINALPANAGKAMVTMEESNSDCGHVAAQTVPASDDACGDAPKDGPIVEGFLEGSIP